MSYKIQNIEWDISLSDINTNELIGFTVDLSSNPFYNPILYTLNSYDIQDYLAIDGKFYYSLDDGETWINFSPSGEYFTTDFKLKLLVNYGEMSNLFFYDGFSIKCLSPDGTKVVSSFNCDINSNNFHIDITKDNLYVYKENTLYKYELINNDIKNGLKLGANSVYVPGRVFALAIDGLRESFWYVNSYEVCLNSLYGDQIFCLSMPEEIGALDESLSSSSSSEGYSSSSSTSSSSSSSSSSEGYSTSSSSSSSSSEGYSSSSSSSSEGYSTSSSSSSSSLTYICDDIITTFIPNMISYFSTSLIYNGDFELGNIGFTSDYEYNSGDDIINCLSNDCGEYYITDNPSSVVEGWPNIGDHTSGFGNMLAVRRLFHRLNLTFQVARYLIDKEMLSSDLIYTFSFWAYGLIREPSNSFYSWTLSVGTSDNLTGTDIDDPLYVDDSNNSLNRKDHRIIYGSWNKYETTIRYRDANDIAQVIIFSTLPFGVENAGSYLIDDIEFTISTLSNPPSIFSSSEQLQNVPEPETPKAWKAFNNLKFDGYGFAGKIENFGFGYIGVSFITPVSINSYSFSNRNESTIGAINYGPETWIFQASNVTNPNFETDTDWINIDTIRLYKHWNNNSFPSYDYSSICIYDIGNSLAFYHYRIKIITIQNNEDVFYINDIKFQEEN